ncbi:MAG TPA: glycosyl hydrolase-related protein, partial [Gemmatimonadaceae bacterium]
PADRAREAPPPTDPLHRYVSRFAPGEGAMHGATLYGDGLAEYEAMADGAIAVTLVRAVGELSRGNLPERPGHAGWPAPTPDAQSHGDFRARFALLLHDPSRTDAVVDVVERAADDLLLPLAATTLRSAIAPVPARMGAALRGEGLAMSTIKESDDGRSLVLRCVNLLDREVRGAWELGVPVEGARLARLDETPLEPLAVQGSAIPFTASPRAIVTVLVPFPPG